MVLRTPVPPPPELLSRSTLAHYERVAEAFWQGTRDHDVEQNIQALLRALGPGSFRILDLGCGPGRDLLRFRELGHEAIGLDGALAFVEMARAHSGCEVWHQDFIGLALPEAFFDGIFANASLFHTPRRELPRVLRQLRQSLRAEGALFCVNPRGPDIESFAEGERYCGYYDLDTWSRLLREADFEVIEHFYRPEGKARDEQPWLAMVSRAKPPSAPSS